MLKTVCGLRNNWLSTLVLLIACGCSSSPAAPPATDGGGGGAGGGGVVAPGSNPCDAPVSLAIPPSGGLPVDPRTNGRAVGAACAFGAQCGSGLCSANVDAGACGVCLERRKLGQSCDGPLQGCASSAFCRGGTCLTNKKGVGQACGLQPKGGDLGDCDDELYCAEVLTDAGVFTDTGICTPRPDLGAACDFGVTCAYGASCYGKTCLDNRSLCVFSPCDPGMFCDSLMTVPACVPTTLMPGELCGISGPDLHHDCNTGMICAGHLVLDGDGGTSSVETCVPLPAEGSACIIGSCAPGLYCAVREVICPQGELLDRRCERLRLEGETCSLELYGRDRDAAYTSCAAGLECRLGVCRPSCQ